MGAMNVSEDCNSWIEARFSFRSFQSKQPATIFPSFTHSIMQRVLALPPIPHASHQSRKETSHFHQPPAKKAKRNFQRTYKTSISFIRQTACQEAPGSSASRLRHISFVISIAFSTSKQHCDLGTKQIQQPTCQPGQVPLTGIRDKCS
jgi:hypothetical protein